MKALGYIACFILGGVLVWMMGRTDTGENIIENGKQKIITVTVESRVKVDSLERELAKAEFRYADLEDIADRYKAKSEAYKSHSQLLEGKISAINEKLNNHDYVDYSDLPEIDSAARYIISVLDN